MKVYYLLYRLLMFVNLPATSITNLFVDGMELHSYKNTYGIENMLKWLILNFS